MQNGAQRNQGARDSRRNNIAHGNNAIQGSNQSNSSQNIIQSTSNASSSHVVQNHFHSASKRVMLATAWVYIVYCGSWYKVRALIDPCSDESFISKTLQKLIKLPTEPVSAEVTGLGGEVVSRIEKMTSFTVVSVMDTDLSLDVEALVVPHVTGNTPTQSFSPGEDLPKLKYADEKFYKGGPIDILLGGDVYPAILRGGVKNNICGSLVAQETIFGWVVTGPSNPRRPVKLCFLRKFQSTICWQNFGNLKKFQVVELSLMMINYVKTYIGPLLLEILKADMS